eukprot:gb/GFBE01068393.1/.p1 GENE.gb/GFBE01068393.1/~~gb/GFBE01068393.1/.p1  ORF type:complete len:1946 (+),score=403.79 gb/GFBE01068393.1/:1-5838(+)
MAPSFGNNAQRLREERVELYGIDCEDQVMWHDWTPGIESVQDLVLQNVALVTQKVKFKLPPTKEFDMPYPEPFKLAPGMKKSIPISFRPSKYVPHVDRVQIITKGGSFFVTVKAVVKDVALSVPHFLDFGLCPTMERSEQHIDIYNTGTLRAAMKWHARPPFTVRCPTDTVDVGQVVRCVVEFEPRTASVFDGLLACEASNADAAAPAADEDGLGNGGSAAAPPEAKQYALQCTGVGKMPHLCVPGGRSPIVEFGSVSPGKRAPQTLELLNTTPVRAAFRVRALHDSGETTPLPPLSFFVSPESGVVEPNCTFTMTFYFQSHTVKEYACQRFQISTPGGTPLVVTCKAFCRPIDVRLSTRSINFGEIPSGKVYSRTLQLHNDSDRPAPYHFVNADHQKGVFWLDRSMGVIPPDSFMVVTVFFGPMAPINYHKKVSCVIKGALAPLTLDLLGSAHTEKSRPARLDQHHIDIFRNMQLSGVREHPAPTENPEEDGNLDDEPPLEELEPKVPEVPVRPLSATATFLDMMLPWDSKLRDITISPGNLDFGQSSVLTMSEKQTVTITNRSSQKVTVHWMVGGESRMLCTPDEKSLFSVYPTSCDIKPKGHADFQVAFRPQSGNTVEGEMLEAVVSQKINRTFRLVDLERFTPPWTLTVRGMGHTMGGTRNDPQVDISETHIRFRPCHPGERTYQVAMLTNPGDMALAYQLLPPVNASQGDVTAGSLQDLKDEVPFRAWPSQGIILPHQFHLLVLEFAPTVAKNDQAYTANFQIVVDYNESQPKTIRVSGRAWKPQLTFCRGQPTVTFPPTCAGIACSMVCTVKNVSEIPISYECRIPARFRSTFWFPEPTGQLAPSESASLLAHFCPSSERVFSAPMYCAALCVEDPDNFVEGPLRSLLLGAAAIKDEEPSYVLQLVGHGKGPALHLEPNGLDLGAVKACEEVKNQVVILNSSQLTVHYQVDAQFVGSDPQAAAVADQALRLGHSEGDVAGRCTQTLEIDFYPPCRGEFVYQVTVTPKGEADRGPSGQSVNFMLRAVVQYPCIQIADLRTECATLQPQSMMWTQFQVDGINELYEGEVAEVERKFQAAIGIDEKKRLVRQLKPFQLLFGTAAVESGPTVVYLVLSNPSRLGIRFSFQTPKNLNLESAPYWCDEKALIDDREAHFSWVEEHGIYDIQPRSGEIPPGDFLHVKMTYHHASIGTHILPVVFNVHDGRSVLLYLKGHSVAPSVGCLSVRSSVVVLQPVPLGVEKGVTQPVELTNSGAVAAPWRVDLESILKHNAENYDFEVLSVTPTEGILQPQSSTFLHFTFTPLEAKRYFCPVRIEMLKDGRPAEELCFELQADGYRPDDERPEVEQQFPSNLPIQTYAPVPGCGAALSIEILDFKSIPLRARNSQMLVLVNYTSEFVLSFRWDARQLFRSEHELEIEPSHGELSPGSHCIVVFRLCCEEPVDVSGEIACQLGWTHLSAYGQRSIGEQFEDPSMKPEYLAYHADHIHEPTRNGKGPDAPVHISVANRLTVSRFRNLMSTAAGQKFLNENLHRTSVLSSHIPTMSPRRAMQASTMGRALQSKEELPGQTSKGMSLADVSLGPQPPTPPTSFPLYVRIRAVVADWMVPPEQRKDFIVESAARNLAARRQFEAGILAEQEADATGELGMLNRFGEDDSDYPDMLQMRQIRRPMSSSSAAVAQVQQELEPAGEIGPDLVSKVLEHMVREVMSEEEFGVILDKMVCQDTPCFVQYEDSAPPGLPEPDRPIAPEPELLRVPSVEDSHAADTAPHAEPAESDDAFDLMEEDPLLAAAMSRRREGLWGSDLLLDFEAPQSCAPPASKPQSMGAGTARGPFTSTTPAVSSSATPSGAADRTARSALEDEHLFAGLAGGDRQLSHGATVSEEDLRRSWEEALAHYGEVDLDAFRDSAGEVLDRLLLDMLDDVIAGRLNWMRPLPRIRSGRRR